MTSSGAQVSAAGGLELAPARAAAAPGAYLINLASPDPGLEGIGLLETAAGST